MNKTGETPDKKTAAQTRRTLTEGEPDGDVDGVPVPVTDDDPDGVATDCGWIREERKKWESHILIMRAANSDARRNGTRRRKQK